MRRVALALTNILLVLAILLFIVKILATFFNGSLSNNAPNSFIVIV